MDKMHDSHNVTYIAACVPVTEEEAAEATSLAVPPTKPKIMKVAKTSKYGE